MVRVNEYRLKLASGRGVLFIKNYSNSTVLTECISKIEYNKW